MKYTPYGDKKNKKLAEELAWEIEKLIGPRRKYEGVGLLAIHNLKIEAEYEGECIDISKFDSSKGSYAHITNNSLLAYPSPKTKERR